jgi:uncharacterized membrane protein
MKEIMKELARLAVLTIIAMVAIFGFMAIVALMLNGLDYLPQYIGGFGTFMLYVAVLMLIFAVVKYFADRDER